MSTFATELHVHNEEYGILPIDSIPLRLPDEYLPPHHHHPVHHAHPTKHHHLNHHIIPQSKQPAQDMLANVLPPIAARHHRLPQPAIVQPRRSSPPPPPVQQRQPAAQPPSQPPSQPPVLPPQQRPAPVPEIKERITVNGIPSQTVVDGKLVIGHDRSTSVRSYTPLKNVGDGSFGTVVLADWHSPLPPGVSISPMQLNIKFNTASSSAPHRMVAIKRMKKKWQGGWAECSQLKELESLRRISPHPNIIPLYDSFLLPETKELYFIFECMEGNLYQLIKSRKGRPLAGGLVASIYRQVVEGLRHIHDSGYFHRDMKPENLLVTTTGLADYSPTSPRVSQPHLAPPEKDVMVIVKLADFGLAREVNSAPPYTEYVSTRWYRAPEVLLRSTNYNKPVDMWALGTILAELVNLKPIFPGQTEVDQVQKIVDVLGNPTTNGEYGVDERGRVRGGGDWVRGVLMAGTVGYTFKKVHPYPFTKLFDRNVPPSLVDCIADLIRYDPDRRLTAQQCKDHPYWKQTENTQRGTIATQPQAPHDRHSSSRHQQQQQPRQAEQQQQQQQQPQQSSSNAHAAEASRKKPSHITVPRPPDTNASSTSSNKSLRAAVAGMGLYGGPSPQQQQQQESQQAQPQQSGFTPGHARSHSTNHAGPSGLGLPAMSPRDIPPSHSHPHSSGKLKPAFNAGHDVVPPLPPLSVPSSHPEGASTSSSAATYHQPHPHYLNHSLSNGNLNVNLSVHRQHGQDQMFSPISPSASPGLFSPISQPGEISPNPDVPMSLGAMQYQQASAAHYAAGDRAYTGRSYGSQPGTAATSKSAELVARMGELDLPPPVPPLPWNAGAPGPSGRDSVMASSVVATIASEDVHGAGDQMDISRGSLELPPIQEQPSQPIPIIPQQQPQVSVTAPVPQPQQPPQPAPVQQSSGSKFGLGIFGKKSRFGLFKHSDSHVDAKATATVSSSKPGEAQMAGPSSTGAVPSAANPGNSLKRGPSDSAGSMNELQAAASSAQLAAARPLDPKAEKKRLAKLREEEQKAKYEARARRQKESSRAVIRKREEVIERKGVKEFEWETTTATLVGGHEPPPVDKGKGVLRTQPSNLTSAIGLSGTNERSTIEPSISGKTLVDSHSPHQQHPQPHQYQPPQPQYLSTHQHELQNHLHRHKARRRDADDDHSMSSSDVHSVSRFSAISRSTVDSDPGPGRHRMPMPGSSKRNGTIAPYPSASGSSGINRTTSVSNLRAGPGPSSFNRGFSPSARSSTSLEQPFIAEFDELGFHQDGRGPFRGDPNGAAAGSFTGPSEMHAGMGVTMVSPPMQMLSLAGSSDPRGTQGMDGQLPPHKYRSQTGSRGRHPPPSFLGMPSLPPISSVHSPTNSTSHELPEVDASGAGSSNDAMYHPGPSESNQSFHLAESSSGNPNGQTLPPFRDIASWADQQHHQAPSG